MHVYVCLYVFSLWKCLRVLNLEVRGGKCILFSCIHIVFLLKGHI